MSKFLDKELLWGEDKIVKYFNRDTLDDARAMNPEIGDMVYITTEDNTYIYRIDEQVSPDPDFYSMSFNGIAVPDYANIENINRIPTPTSTWTVDRTGFIIYYGNTSSANNYFVNINGVGVLQIFTSHDVAILGVKKGDIISISGVNPFFGSNTYCKFIPPRFIKEKNPIIAENFKNYICTPDYDNVREIVITGTMVGNDHSYEYTVTSACYFKYNIYATSSVGNCYMDIYINNKSYKLIGTSPISGTSSLDTITYFSDIILLNVGDTIRLRVNADNTSATVTVSNNLFRLFPLKFSAVQSPVVEQGSDYSLTEHPVLINDNGLIRQKLDIDGDPIWCRTVRGNITLSSNTEGYIAILSTYVKKLLNQHGWWDRGDNYNEPVPINFTTASFWLYKRPNGDIAIRTISVAERTNSPYMVYIEYTKI
jgi:hypothetical protein